MKKLILSAAIVLIGGIAHAGSTEPTNADKIVAFLQSKTFLDTGLQELIETVSVSDNTIEFSFRDFMSTCTGSAQIQVSADSDRSALPKTQYNVAKVEVGVINFHACAR